MIVQSQKADIEITGSPKWFSVDVKEGEVNLLLRKETLRFLECRCKDGFVRYSEGKENSFQWHGPGNNIVTIRLNEGDIHTYWDSIKDNGIKEHAINK